MKTKKIETVTGYPFVSHVDQNKRPTLKTSYIDVVFSDKYHSDLNNLLKGYIKFRGYIFDLKPYLKKYLYKSHDAWIEAYAPSKTALRHVIPEKIEKIIDITNL